MSAHMDTPQSSPTLSVIEAARYLGIHRNTVLARIHKGTLYADSVVLPDGRHIYRIPLHVLPKDASARPDFRAHKGAERTTEDAQREIVPSVPVEQVQVIFKQFWAEIGHVRQELGKVTAERDAALARVQALEAERGHVHGDQAAPRRSLWARLRSAL